LSRILEVGIFQIKPEQVERMEELGREIAEHRSQSENQPEGWHSVRLYRAIEDPNRFVLHATWDSAEDSKQSSGSAWDKKTDAALAECLASEADVNCYELVEGTAAGTPDLSKVLQVSILPVTPEGVDRFEQIAREIVDYRAQPENQPSEENGWHSTWLYRSIEDPFRYLRHGTWNAADDHLRSGDTERGKRIGAILKECLATPPIRHHYNLVAGASAGDSEL
jgi:quinol monooxygenase YgiN